MDTLKWFIPCLIPIVFGFTIPFWEEDMTEGILTAIIAGGVAILAAILGFAASCKSSNGVTREARDKLSKEQSDGKNQLSKEHSELKSELSKELGGQLSEVKHLIDKDISVKEVKMQLFSDKQKDIAKTVDDVNCFLKDWEQKTINEQNLKTELMELKEKYEKVITQISSLQNENEMLKRNNSILTSALGLPQDKNVVKHDDEYER